MVWGHRKNMRTVSSVFVQVRKSHVTELLNDLVDIQFERNDVIFQRGRFIADVVEIFPASRDEHTFRVNSSVMKLTVSEKSKA